jgi:hypothetical protein
MILILGLLVLVAPTLFLAKEYLPASGHPKTEYNPGITFGSIIGMFVMAFYIIAIVSTSGFENVRFSNRFLNIYVFPAIELALIIFPRYAAVGHKQYSAMVEFDATWIVRLMGYSSFLFTLIRVTR